MLTRTAPTLPILFALLVLAACGDEPGVHVYEVNAPAPYPWPATEARDVAHEAGGVTWVWRVPAGWVDAPEVPEQLVADYRFKGTTEDLPGRMTMSMISGSAGGIEANVLRWRQQLFATPVSGLGPGDMLSEPMPIPVGEVVIVELRGQYQGPNLPTHLLGAIITVAAQGGGTFQTWFFKMVGDEATIEANKLAMTRLMLSFRPEGVEAPELPEDLNAPTPADIPTPPQPAPDTPAPDTPAAPGTGGPAAPETASPAQEAQP